MNTLHKNDALFNTNLSISHDGGCLSSDAGLVLVKQVMREFDTWTLENCP